MKKILAVTCFIFLALAARLFYLQVYRGETYEAWSRRITLHNIPIFAPRGVIADRNGIVLADNQPVFEAYLHRDDMSEDVLPEAFPLWAALLQISVDDLNAAWARSKKQSRYTPVLLNDNLSEDQLLKWRQARLDDVLHQTEYWKGLEILYRPNRQYTQPEPQEAFSHLLGYIRPVHDKDLEKDDTLLPQDRIGSLGVEEHFDTALRGKNGENWKWVDAHGREVEPKVNPELMPGDVPAIPGDTLTLSIDAELQAFAYNRFGDKAGALVAMKVDTGELISLVSVPGFNNSAFIGGIPASYWKSLLDDPKHPLIDRAISGIYPPGSTYKIVTSAAALEKEIITDKDESYCPGYFMFGGHRFGCWNKRGHGSVALIAALERSCDVYYYRIGLKLTVDELASVAARFGYGAKSALGLRNEKAGFIPTVDGLKKRYKQTWDKGYMFPVVIGQGSNAVTPLQQATMISRMAANNARLSPTILKTDTPSLYAPLLSPERHELIRKGLEQVVYGGGGTAGRLRNLPFTLAGKTGTAQAGGNKGDHAWFVAYAPKEKPVIAIAALVEHGGHGGSVAAPIVADYLKKYFERYPQEEK